jgi:hypothetical protein
MSLHGIAWQPSSGTVDADEWQGLGKAGKSWEKLGLGTDADTPNHPKGGPTGGGSPLAAW